MSCILIFKCFRFGHIMGLIVNSTANPGMTELQKYPLDEKLIIGKNQKK